MPKKEKIPAPGGKKDEYTNFYKKGKWKQVLGASALDLNGRNLRAQGALIVGNALSKNRFVMKLDLCHNHIGDEGAISLAQMLKVNEVIQYVNLSCNEIGDIGAIAIASAFVPYANPSGQPSQWNRAVWELNLSGNRLGNDALVALCNAAACSRDLSKIDVTHNQIGPLGCKAIPRAMQRNQLCTFLLSDNRIGDEGAALYAGAVERYGGAGTQSVVGLANNDLSKGGADAIGQLIANCENVGVVNLSWNTLGFRGTQTLVTQLVGSPNNLRALNLANNCLEKEGGLEIARLIEANLPALTTINVSDNHLGDEAGVALARALEKNSYLQQFLAVENSFGDRAADAFAELPPTSKVLRVVDIKRNPFSDSRKTKLSAALNNKASDYFRLNYDASIGDESHDFIKDFCNKLGSALKYQQEQEEANAKKKKRGRGASMSRSKR